jgi:hypothetical protein
VTIQEDNKTIFCAKYDELSELVKSSNPYDLTKASALIRHLLIDGSPLMDQINRIYRLKITFPVSKISIPDLSLPINRGLQYWDIQDGLYSEDMKHLSVEVKRDKLLSKGIMLVKGNQITVKDAVKFEANVKGGVHTREADISKDEEKSMEILSQSIKVGGYRPTQRIMKAIGRSVLEGLKELRKECGI